MSIVDFEQASGIIEQQGDADFEGPKREALVASAEAALGLSFPPTYRRFLLELGCGDIGGQEFYGLIDDNFTSSSVPNGIWLTLNERSNIGLHADLVIVATTGDGNYYALDTAQTDAEGECPVVEISPTGEKLDVVAPDFGAFLLAKVKAAV